MVEMGFESSLHVAVQGAVLEQLVEQPVLVGWNNETNDQRKHIGCLSTAAARRGRANLTLHIGRAGFGSHQRLLISFHLPVSTRATQRKSEKNMYLIVPAEHLRLEVDLVDFEELPETTRGQLRNNSLEEMEKGLVHARFSLMTAAYVVMPKLRRPLARPLAGAPGRLMSSLRALSEAKEFDVYLSRGDVEHRLQKIRSTLDQHLIETPDLNIHATFGGGFGGGKNVWESYPCVEDGEFAWNPLVDDAPPPYEDGPAELPATFEKVELAKVEKLPAQPPPEMLSRRVVSWSPDRNMRLSAQNPSTFLKSEPSTIKKLLSQYLPSSWSPDPHMRFTDAIPQRPVATINGHTRRVLSDGAILAKSEARAPNREVDPDPTEAYKGTTKVGTSNISPSRIAVPADARQSDGFGDEKSILSAYSTFTSSHHQLPAPISPPSHPPHTELGTDGDSNANLLSPIQPNQTASLIRTAVLAYLDARGPSNSSSPLNPALLHTPNLFLELQEFLATAAQLDPLFHETHRAQLFALGAAAREGRTRDFDAGLHECQKSLLGEAWRQWPPAENLLDECFKLLEWLNGHVCRNAGTVMMSMLVGLRGAAQGVRMRGGVVVAKEEDAGSEAEKAWREAVVEVRAVAFWAFG